MGLVEPGETLAGTSEETDVKYAQFKDTKLGTVMVVGRADDDLERPFLEDVRISEWVEIDFPPLPLEDIVAAQLAALDAEQRTLVAQHLRDLEKIANARAKLLALTHESAA